VYSVFDDTGSDKFYTKGARFMNLLGSYAVQADWNQDYPNSGGQVAQELPGTVFTCPSFNTRLIDGDGFYLR